MGVFRGRNFPRVQFGESGMARIIVAQCNIVFQWGGKRRHREPLLGVRRQKFQRTNFLGVATVNNDRENFYGV